MIKQASLLFCVLTLASMALASASEDHGTGAYGCIGIAIESQQGIFVVQKDIPGSPAEAAGMAFGDVIESVQSSPDLALMPVSGKTLDEVVQMIRGPIGTPVVVDVVRGGQTVEFSMVRQEIHPL